MWWCEDWCPLVAAELWISCSCFISCSHLKRHKTTTLTLCPLVDLMSSLTESRSGPGVMWWQSQIKMCVLCLSVVTDVGMFYYLSRGQLGQSCGKGLDWSLLICYTFMFQIITHILKKIACVNKNDDISYRGEAHMTLSGKSVVVRKLSHFWLWDSKEPWSEPLSTHGEKRGATGHPGGHRRTQSNIWRHVDLPGPS